ncbi:exo-1,3-beta-D-glucanase [Colletotrichum truncatum]|uniref:Exo-1,3-beta-D-glucanase n=1 Tax=Colletotrichum truncatum TaxID=5467 RepID=A0ACC3YEP9_COLTU|nr:exo-1,3-beta-D-glucanase [Colletotrichum truncatum]KAF6783271.1 exo-1,3-beta-D-glucanase [Colletotrichum truncatum]
MISEAVENMRSVVEVAEKVLEAERKSIIANFLTAIFMLIPVAGEAVGALGATTMRAIIGIAGEVGNVGMTIYELINEPKGAVMTILGFVMGGGVSRQPFREAAAARRGMSSTDTGKLTPRIKNDIGTMAHVRSQCLKR